MTAANGASGSGAAHPDDERLNGRSRCQLEQRRDLGRHHPAPSLVDVASGALFLIGVGIVVARYVRRRSWMDLFLLLSIPLLMAPSILSLAFPEENPAPNRAGGALVPVFTVAGLALVALLSGLRAAWSRRAGVVVAAGVGILFVGLALTNNYRMLFQDFADGYRRSSWNTKDAGDVIRGFADSVGTTATAHVVPTRTGSIRLVDSRRARRASTMPCPEAIDGLAGKRGAALHREHQRSRDHREASSGVPEGVVQTFLSGIEGRDFWIFVVPQRGLAP
jgi:hypothetical protein